VPSSLGGDRHAEQELKIHKLGLIMQDGGGKTASDSSQPHNPKIIHMFIKSLNAIDFVYRFDLNLLHVNGSQKLCKRPHVNVNEIYNHNKKILKQFYNEN